MSHPTWVRGLKYSAPQETNRSHVVAPYMGAWIEIGEGQLKWYGYWSHPTLGKLKGIKEIGSFNDEKPEYILILANHDPAKTVLRRELENTINSSDYTELCKKATLKVATSCLMGYGFIMSVFIQ